MSAFQISPQLPSEQQEAKNNPVEHAGMSVTQHQQWLRLIWKTSTSPSDSQDNGRLDTRWTLSMDDIIQKSNFIR